MVRGGAKLSDVAAAAGVHPSTASRALDPDLAGRLSDAVVQRVRQAAEDLGYSRNGIAASLRTRQSRIIGVVVPDLTNTMFPPMFRGIEERLSAEGYSAILANSDFQPAKERAIIETFLDRRIDGMILASAHLDDARDLAALARKVPVVLLNREMKTATISAVVADERQGIGLAFAHLASLGHRRIAHIAGPQDVSTGVARRQAFLACLQEAGLAADPARVPVAGSFSEAEGFRLTKMLLAAAVPPTAILAANDWLALGAIRALEEGGLRCPQDVSVTGFNDMPFADRFRPPLTTIHIPHHYMGREAAEQLLAAIRTPSAPVRRVVMASSLILRASTAAPSTGAV